MKKISITILVIIVLIGVYFIITMKPANNTGGEVKQVATSTISTISTTTSVIPQKTSFSLAEVAMHSTAKDCWIAINGNVYDVTDFIASGQHNEKILNGCGKDATSMFGGVENHSGDKAQLQLSKLKIGTIK